WLMPRGRRQTLQQFGRIQRLLAQSRELEQSTLAEAKATSERQAGDNLHRRDRDIAAARQVLAGKQAAARVEHAAEVARAEAEKASTLVQLEEIRTAAIAAADAKYPPLLDERAAA